MGGFPNILFVRAVSVSSFSLHPKFRCGQRSRWKFRQVKTSIFNRRSNIYKNPRICYNYPRRREVQGKQWEEGKNMNQLMQGMKDGSAIGIGYFSVSFTFGLAAVSSGLCWWEALLVSMMNLTSAGQFAGITVMASAGSYAEMAISQLVINLRYALMGISLSQKVDRRFLTPQKSVLGFAITDEIFAVAMSREGEVGSAYFSGLALLPYLGWTAGTLTGAVCGNVLPGSIRNALGIAIYGMFIAIIIPAMKQDGRILKMAALAVAFSCCMHYLPVLRNVSEGFSVIICAVAASAVGAFFYPMEEAKEEGRV